MNDIDRKARALVEKINIELRHLGSGTIVSTGMAKTEDTGEMYHTVEISMGACKYLSYSSQNWVGIKTFLQGMLLVCQLASGNYRLKPLTEIARRQMPVSIIPRLLREDAVGPKVRNRPDKTMLAGVHPRFAFHRSKFK